jgi:GNAT superfamily N-acetyltransferase
VSAATADGPWRDADLRQAEAAMGAQVLFLIRDGETALDRALAARGYGIVDPVVAYACAAAKLARPPHMTTFPHWPPLAIARDLWAEGGIGPERVAVMDRVRGPKAAILVRQGDRPAGAAFVAAHGSTAMLHALEITPPRRRQGSAHHILMAAAHWALDQGADTLSLVVTAANEPARALYASLGMQVVGHYHYRQR